MRSTPWLAQALVLAVVAAPCPALAQDTTSKPSQVYTAATVVRYVRPELAVVTIRFSATGATPSEAGAHVALRADSLRTALQGLGIPHDSLISGSQWYWWRGRVEVHPRSQCVTRPDAPPRTGCTMTYDTTYTVNDAIEIRLRDLMRVGAAIDTALAHRITDISSVSFRAGDVHIAQEDALREATRRARGQAQAIAEASGATLGRIISLSTQPPGGSEPYPGLLGITMNAAGFSGDAGSGTTVIEPSMPVSVTVYGKWELTTGH